MGLKTPKNVNKYHMTDHVAHRSGLFFARFKKLKAPFKKTQADFWQKTHGNGGNFGYQEKNSIVFDKNLQNSFKSSMKFYPK